MRRFLYLSVCLFLVFLTSCAYVKVPLFEATEPLKEKVLAGEAKTKILLIDIYGTISEQEKPKRFGSGDEGSLVSHVKEQLEKARRDKDVKGIILKIDSPGGTVTASDMIYHEVLQFKQKTGVKVHACIMGLGTSGGYYVASAADEIMAHPTAITGSIGVIAMKFDVKELMDKFGVQNETFKSGQKKDILSPFRPSTPEEAEIMQNIISGLYGRFVDVVEKNRANILTRDNIVKLADGRIYTADQALAAKLIDRVGYMDDAISAMEKTLKTEKAKIVMYYRPGTYKGSIYSGYPATTSPIINLINISAENLVPNMQFMYIWRP